MSESLDKMANVFLDEANDLLDKLEDHLLKLEECPDDADTIGAVFRTMHTIKGSAGMFGFDAISKFTHQAENTFDAVRNGRVSVSSELITITLQVRDHIRNMLERPNDSSLNDITEALVSKLQVYLLQNDKTANPEAASTGNCKDNAQSANENESGVIVFNSKAQDEPVVEEKTEAQPEKDITEVTYRIKFEPASDILQNGTRPHALIAELMDLGTATVIPFFRSIPSFRDLNPTKCYMSWEILLTTVHSVDEIKDVFIFLDADSKISIKKVVDSEQYDSYKKRLGEILIDKNVITQEQIDNAINSQKPLGKILQEQKLVSKEDVHAALKEQQHINAQKEKQNLETNSQTIKVTSAKLDKLIDLVGELVTFNARLNQISQNSNLQVLSTVTEQGERLILELRDTTMDMRMLPIGSIFSRFRRLVRDLASETSKKIELVTEGAETELDKTVIEKLNDPLVHLIRNSIDHGIENPCARKAAGKEELGTVKLKAQHAGAFVLITIEDDGAGLNLDKIKQKAIAKELISANDDLTDSQIADLIFMPGFSTADKVTSISGRGVGMDVVKRDITTLGGTVSISTEKGKGSKFTLKIPLTLAIIEGILVQVGENSYVLPLANVVECLTFKPELGDGKFCSTAKIRDEMMPYIDLRNYFKIDGERPEQQQIVIVNDQETNIGIVIDKVIGNYQTVIKPLGKLYSNVQGISGATILGDGSVALILDAYKLSDIVGIKDKNN